METIFQLKVGLQVEASKTQSQNSGDLRLKMEQILGQTIRMKWIVW